MNIDASMRGDVVRLDTRYERAMLTRACRGALFDMIRQRYAD